MGQKTPLYSQHVDAGAKIVDFGGWDMPLHYGSQLEEHHQVRSDAGMFDVSHMTVVDISGQGAQPFLQHLLANDVAKLTTQGKALYTCMLNHSGGVIDDLIVYYFAADDYRIVVNAATRDKDIAWIQNEAQHFAVEIKERSDLSMLAIQGPNARERIFSAFTPFEQSELAQLKVFNALRNQDWMVARTGYTGEDGVEVCLPADSAVTVWQKALEADVKPCGLGARDTLRLEAGMNLYGNDMDESTTPLVSGLGWTVALKDPDGKPRAFVGAQALRDELAMGLGAKLIGVVLEGKGVLRAGQKLFEGEYPVGSLTSGTFSPTLAKSIGFARVSLEARERSEVEIRGRRLPVRLVELPFVRRGKVLVDLEIG